MEFDCLEKSIDENPTRSIDKLEYKTVKFKPIQFFVQKYLIVVIDFLRDCQQIQTS